MDQVYLNIETSGLSELHDSIVEIAALKIDGKSNVKTLFHCYFNPEKKLDAITCGSIDLTNDFLSQCPKFEEKVFELLTFIESAELFVFNKAFIFKFLNVALQKVGQPNIKNAVHDLLELSNDRFPKDIASLDFLFRALNVQSAITKGVIHEIFLLPMLFQKIRKFDIEKQH